MHLNYLVDNIMIKINDIIYPVKEDMIKFNSFLKESTQSKVDLVNVIINYILKISITKYSLLQLSIFNTILFGNCLIKNN